MSDVTTLPDDDLAALLIRRERARPNKLTWVLLTLLVLTIGFVAGGVVAQRVGGSTTTLPMGGLPSGFTPPGMSGFSPTAGDDASGETVGTVTLVDGTNVYITTETGTTVKVKVPATASVTAQEDIALSDLVAGSTVTVQGETADDGTVTATSVSSQSITQGEN